MNDSSRTFSQGLGIFIRRREQKTKSGKKRIGAIKMC